MAKITSLTELTEVADDDLLVAVDKSDTSMADSGTDKKVKKVNLLKGLVPENGWIPAGETCSYASADDPTYTMYVSGNATTYLWAGMRFKCTQTTDRMFIITAVGTYDSGNNRTPITLYGGTDFDLANATISNPYYSPVKCPYGFPMNPEKWSVRMTDTTERSQDDPTTNVYYNLGSLSMSIPTGIWELEFGGLARAKIAAAGSVGIQLGVSTSNNSVSHSNLLTEGYGNGTIDEGNFLTRSAVITQTSKATWYVISSTRNIQVTRIGIRNNVITFTFTATCAYL